MDNKFLLKEIADAIKNNIDVVSSPLIKDEVELEFEEGKLLTRVHRYRERSSSLIKKKKNPIIMIC